MGTTNKWTVILEVTTVKIIHLPVEDEDARAAETRAIDITRGAVDMVDTFSASNEPIKSCKSTVRSLGVTEMSRWKTD